MPLDQVSKDHEIGWDGHMNAGLRIKYVSEIMDSISTCRKNATVLLKGFYKIEKNHFFQTLSYIHLLDMDISRRMQSSLDISFMSLSNLGTNDFRGDAQTRL